MIDYSAEKGSDRSGDRKKFSPLRSNVSHGKNNAHRKKRHDSDSDFSPERIKSRSSPVQEQKLKKTSMNRRESDSDFSRPRPFRSQGKSPSDEKNRPVKTLSGLKAGLQNAAILKQETQELRERERKQINKLHDDISGRNAETIIRDRKTGKKRDIEAENRIKEEEESKKAEQQEKYSKWGKGIEQEEIRKNKLSEDLYEISKPLARYQNDEDLEEMLKSVIYDDDPMSAYMKKKKQKTAGPSMPVYSGPPPPPNRFGIQPGYRWDGVDRSNGFEKKYFEKHNSTKAIQEEAYLWSVQNM
ncbi:BUD13 homolog [Stegodyphus dumicola]|uniref:BUD13 homolog n=1 Tax=Stegodyphus dumicola TaxID=202533 RepID=UPI0015AE1082|nr:BUD13 homolog [Stegodyphus dumicola]